MNPETVKELKKYLKPGNGWKIGGIVCLVLALIYGALLPVLTVLCLVIAALCFWRCAAAGRKMTGEMGVDVVQDYAAAVSMFNGELRVGNRYLFGKNHGKAVPYEDIQQVYQHVQKTYFIETNRNLMYKGANGKVRALCKLPLKDAARDDVMKVMVFIHTKNPGVKLGYK